MFYVKNWPKWTCFDFLYKVTNNQMKQLYELLKGSFNITVNLDYNIEGLYGYTNFDAQISYELTSIY